MTAAPASRGPSLVAWPVTLALGLLTIAGAVTLTLIDLQNRGGLIIPTDKPLPDPTTTLQHLARWAAINMTGLGWLGYLLAFDGLSCMLARIRGDPTIAPFRARPNRFVIAWLTSIPVWCLFDAINFYWMDAWRYHGLPPAFAQRLLGYFVAFAAISPGMFIAAHLIQHMGMRRWQRRSDQPAKRLGYALVFGPPVIITIAITALLATRDDELATIPMIVGTPLLLLGPGFASWYRNRCPYATSFAIGLGFVTWVALVQAPITNMALWVGLIYLIDPVVKMLKGPSLVQDWFAGQLGRTASLMLGGAVCGLLWEAWNYAALAKWTYHLPFLGAAEHVRYFEMPALGFLGFLPFACECWVMLNLIIAVAGVVRLRIAEPIPSHDDIM